MNPEFTYIYLARKPFDGTVASNVLEHGTGAIHVDACRIGHNDPVKLTQRTVGKFSGTGYAKDEYSLNMDGGTMASANPEGRWPANLCLDETAAAMLDEQSGTSKSSDRPRHNAADRTPTSWGKGANVSSGFSDSGGASRFFYVAKADETPKEGNKENMKARILTGDCRETLKMLPDDSIDAIVTDPPYGLSFMGKGWDHSVPGPEYFKEMLRVAKPGAHIVAFSGTRTGHRLACAIEDAGWELRDCLMWLYGSGFPKSHDVSKAIDREAGAEREVVGPDPQAARRNKAATDSASVHMMGHGPLGITAPATPAAAQWQGWGTALKPAWEPIYLARKPLVGTVAANVLEHGTGAINVDACRIAGEGQMRWEQPRGGIWSTDSEASAKLVPTAEGRWPANLCLDETAAAMLDEQSGTSKSSDRPRHNAADRTPTSWGKGANVSSGFSDSGGASRFFYVAKASRSEREKGLEGFESNTVSDGRQTVNDTAYQRDATLRKNTHPTVKPIALMQWLIKLITPPGGIVLDPFNGSGSTGCAAVSLGHRYIGCELNPEYVDISMARMRAWAK